MDKKRFLKKTVYLLSAFLLLLPVLAFAFEIDYPVIPGVPSPSDLLSFINYLYYFLLIAGAMVSSLSLIYGGVIYFFSSGNPGKTFFARQQIFASFLGLAIILLSFLILKILNPDVAILKIPGLNYPVNQPLISPSRPKELTIAFYELPMGVLQERVLQKTQAITSPVNYPEIIASDVRTIEQKSKELRTLLNQCKCSNLKPDCDTNCSALECVTAIGGEPTQLDLCPNLAAIEAKQQEIKNWQDKLGSDQWALKIAQVNLEIASAKLGTGRALLSACLPMPMNLKTFLGVKDMGGIVVKTFFTDIGGINGNSFLICSDSPSPISLPAASGSCKFSNADSAFGSIPKLNDMPGFVAIVEAAAQSYNVPPGLILGVMFGESAFEGKYDFTNGNNVENWSCEGGGVPNCDPNVFPSTGIIPFYEDMWNNLKDAVNRVASSRAPNPCNLIDATFAVAKDLSQSQNGSGAFAGKTCFGISLNAAGGGSNSCSWDSSDYETAIRVWEFGTGWDSATKSCMTKLNSCFTGGGPAAQCPTGGDTCETVSNRYTQTSHNGCIWDVANHYK